MYLVYPVAKTMHLASLFFWLGYWGVELTLVGLANRASDPRQRRDAFSWIARLLAWQVRPCIAIAVTTGIIMLSVSPVQPAAASWMTMKIALSILLVAADLILVQTALRRLQATTSENVEDWARVRMARFGTLMLALFVQGFSIAGPTAKISTAAIALAMAVPAILVLLLVKVRSKDAIDGLPHV